MEHQSSVTYGNKFLQGYLGRDRSNTGWGLKFDYIIIHESGHEWFANNITVKDVADLWVQEGFTCYSESLFLDYYYGKQAASEYVIGLRNHISNDKPLIGIYNVNKEGSSDMYDKGANILHTLRQLIEDDEKWRKILRGLNTTFYHQTVTSQQIENYISEQSGIDLTAFFNQYLRTVKIPTLEYAYEKKTLKYRWINSVDGFDMPVKVTIDNEEKWLHPKAKWQTLALASKNNLFKVDTNFYIEVKQL
jgi:aminopeptidase N